MERSLQECGQCLLSTAFFQAQQGHGDPRLPHAPIAGRIRCSKSAFALPPRFMHLLRMTNSLASTFNPLITADSLPKLCWPLFALIALWVLRRPIHELIGKVTEGESKWFKLKFAQAQPLHFNFRGPEAATVVQTTNPPPTGPAPGNVPTQDSIPYYKTAHFYWLGSDLMEATRNVALKWDKANITRPLRQSLWHFKQAGLNDSAIEAKMAWLIDIAAKKLASDWNNETTRKDIVNEIVIIWQMVSQLVGRKAGPQFKAFATD